MKSRFAKFFQIIFALSFTAIIGYLLFLFARKTWTAFSSLNPTVAAGLLVASATIIVSIISVLISKQIERKTIISNELREKKVPIYEELIEFIFRVTFSQKKGEEPISEKELTEKMIKFTQNLVIWGADEVINAFYKFRMAGVEMQTGAPSIEIMFRVEDMLFAIRKDLGHKNKGMKQGKILGLFVNDIQDYLKTS
jgi:hypothetical protein